MEVVADSAAVIVAAEVVATSVVDLAVVQAAAEPAVIGSKSKL